MTYACMFMHTDHLWYVGMFSGEGSPNVLGEGKHLLDLGSDTDDRQVSIHDGDFVAVKSANWDKRGYWIGQVFAAHSRCL